MGMYEMSTEIVVGILSLVGTGMGSVVGIIMSNRLSIYRIKQLELKMDKHNCLIERMAKVEESCKSAHHRIDDMEN